MIFELTKLLEKIDNSLSIKVSTEGSITCIEVESDIIGSLYSFSSTNRLEVFDKVRNYIGCLEDCDRFEQLIKEVSTEFLEV